MPYWRGANRKSNMNVTGKSSKTPKTKLKYNLATLVSYINTCASPRTISQKTKEQNGLYLPGSANHCTHILAIYVLITVTIS